MLQGGEPGGGGGGGGGNNLPQTNNPYKETIETLLSEININTLQCTLNLENSRVFFILVLYVVVPAFPPSEIKQ